MRQEGHRAVMARGACREQGRGGWLVLTLAGARAASTISKTYSTKALGLLWVERASMILSPLLSLTGTFFFTRCAFRYVPFVLPSTRNHFLSPSR